MVADLWKTATEQNPSSSPRELTSFQGRLLFSASDIEHGTELWISDGTSDGTSLVADVAPGPVDSDPRDIVTQGKHAFFAAEEPSCGRELWAFDDMTSSPRLVRDIRPGNAGANPQQLTFAAENLYFLADGGSGTSLWCSDGTSAGTMPLSCESSTASAVVLSGLFEYGSDMYLYASELNGQNSLCRADRNALKLRRVITFPEHETGLSFLQYRGSESTVREDVHVVLDQALLLSALFPFGRSHPCEEPVPFAGALYFAAYTPEYGMELWKSVKTISEASLVADAFPGRPSSSPALLTSAGGRLFFVAEHPKDGPRALEFRWTIGRYQRAPRV